MTEICPRVPPANAAITRFIERPRVGRPLRVLDVQLPARRERMSVPAVPRRQKTVILVDTARYCFNEILRRAQAHQVSRAIFRRPWRDVADDQMNHCLLFSDAQNAE